MLSAGCCLLVSLDTVSLHIFIGALGYLQVGSSRLLHCWQRPTHGKFAARAPLCSARPYSIIWVPCSIGRRIDSSRAQAATGQEERTKRWCRNKPDCEVIHHKGANSKQITPTVARCVCVCHCVYSFMLSSASRYKLQGMGLHVWGPQAVKAHPRVCHFVRAD